MTRDQLAEYCDKHDIWYPSGCKKEVLEALVVRAYLHRSSMNLPKTGCFGYWDNEAGACLTCDHEKLCFETSFGMPKEEFMQMVSRVKNAKPRFSKALRKPTKRLQSKKGQ